MPVCASTRRDQKMHVPGKCWTSEERTCCRTFWKYKQGLWWSKQEIGLMTKVYSWLIQPDLAGLLLQKQRRQILWYPASWWSGTGVSPLDGKWDIHIEFHSFLKKTKLSKVLFIISDWPVRDYRNFYPRKIEWHCSIEKIISNWAESFHKNFDWHFEYFLVKWAWPWEFLTTELPIFIRQDWQRESFRKWTTYPRIFHLCQVYLINMLLDKIFQKFGHNRKYPWIHNGQNRYLWKRRE